jgi:AcrR family transcriptional regulator
MPQTPGGASRHTRNPRGAGDRLRQDLIAAAGRLLEQGATHESLSLRAVAREVGIAATSVYLHFPDKASLLLALYAGHFAELTRAVTEAIAAEQHPAARLRAATLAYCRFAAEQPDAYYVMFTAPGRTDPPGGYPESGRVGAALIEAVQQVIADCMAAGLMRDGNPYHVTVCLWAALHGLITLRAARPQALWPAQDELVEALLTTWLTTG